MSNNNDNNLLKDLMDKCGFSAQTTDTLALAASLQCCHCSGLITHEQLGFLFLLLEDSLTRAGYIKP